MQGKPNVRRSVLDDAAFQRLYDAADAYLRPVLLVAYDTGMRNGLGLQWSQVNLGERVIKLAAGGHQDRASPDRGVC